MVCKNLGTKKFFFLKTVKLLLVYKNCKLVLCVSFFSCPFHQPHLHGLMQK